MTQTVVQAQTPPAGRGRRLRSVAARLTTPLLPDDYLQLVNPLWSTRELRGRVERVVPRGVDAATLVLRPGWGWTFNHRPGQYLGIGVQVGGRWHWRSYSLTSPATDTDGLLEITVKAMPEGFVSDHLVNGLAPGTVVRLAAPKGEFVLPDPVPARTLFLAAGSGITPIVSMLRTLDRRARAGGTRLPDVVLVHSAPDPDRMLFRDELHRLAVDHPGLQLVERYTADEGRLDLTDTADLDRACPDWRERDVWACGPAALLDAAETLWAANRLTDRLHLERFSTTLTGGGEAGDVSFSRSGRTVAVDGATTLLHAGESAGIGMPAGCRMGICHTCVVPLLAGTVRDLRSGQETTSSAATTDDVKIQTCVSAAVGDCVLDA